MNDLTHIIPGRRRSMGRVALLAVTILSAVTLSQCRVADDRLTGVHLDANPAVSDRGECVQQCQDRFRQALDAEEARHEAVLVACGEDTACKQAENDLHAQIRAQILEDMKNCKKNCYNEGGGKGGGD